MTSWFELLYTEYIFILSGRSGTRTHTEGILSPLPLPLGYTPAKYSMFIRGRVNLSDEQPMPQPEKRRHFRTFCIAGCR